MLYAKRAFRGSPARLARRLAAEVAAQPSAGLEEARGWLIAAGQIEQGALDAGDPGAEALTAATRLAAGLFLEARAARGGPASRAAAARLGAALSEAAARAGDRDCEIRIPEGFAWYALYPDAYAETAAIWAASAAGPADGVNVIGLRSIGTTLAAVVAEALPRHGVPVLSCTTLRPSGHPFDRRAELPARLVPAARNIVVDEGPGLSGSSMVAAADALLRAGAARSSIVFFCGHDNGPGEKGSDQVRAWWSRDRVWSTAAADLTVVGCTLHRRLADDASCRLDETADGPAKPLGLGDWRALAGLSRVPRAVAPLIETPKFIVRGRSGSSLLLKFAGLAATGPDLAPMVRLQLRRLEELACRGMTPAHVDAGHGWIAVPWIEGARLTAADATPDLVIRHIAPVIAASSRPIPPDEASSGIGRIAEALAAWAAERQLEREAALIHRAAHRVRHTIGGWATRSSGDGRLAPHEWVRRTDGRILKLDAAGHDHDHTWVGAQALEWDLAGAEIEWSLTGPCATALRTAVLDPHERADAMTRAFYRAGYCAFRQAAAQCSAAAARDVRLERRLRAAARWYERGLVSALATLRSELD